MFRTSNSGSLSEDNWLYAKLNITTTDSDLFGRTVLLYRGDSYVTKKNR